MTNYFVASLANRPLSSKIDVKMEVEHRSFVTEMMDSSELWCAELIFHSMAADLGWTELFDEEVIDLPLDVEMDFSRHPEAATAVFLKHSLGVEIMNMVDLAMAAMMDLTKILLAAMVDATNLFLTGSLIDLFELLRVDRIDLYHLSAVALIDLSEVVAATIMVDTS